MPDKAHGDWINVPTQHGGVACPKPVKRKTLKGRKDRAEAKQKHMVRMLCVARDGDCRIVRPGATIEQAWEAFGECRGESEWAHMHEKRRSQTRGLPPEVRHTTAHSFMACTRHHDMYDGRQSPRLFVTALTRQGADGPLKVRLGK